MRSPGRPDPSRVVQRQFWRLIATGVTTAEASLAVGVSWPVGSRWFRHAGGMPPISLDEPTGRYLAFEEREEIAILRAQDKGVREIARAIGRAPGTVSRELRRDAATRSGKQEYRATVAQWKAQQAAKRPKAAKLAGNDRLREYVQERLAGSVRRPDGTIVTGPKTPAWKGLNKLHRQDRRWATAWSPEQISRRLHVDFPDDESMRISHEAIYQALFIEGRGALKRELVTCLRTGRALRTPRARSQNKPQGHVTADVVLSERPAEAGDRAVPGHWEGDLIIGTGRSAIGTLVERSSRSTLLVHLPRLEGSSENPPVKNGTSLGGYGAIAMNAALTTSMTQLPEQLRKTLTWDRGKELSGHAQFAFDTRTKVFFADPHSPWQRPTNENTNGLLRQYFPKGTDRPDGPPRTSKWSPRRSTTGPARSSVGGHRPKSSRNSYARYNSPVLQRPVELTLDLSVTIATSTPARAVAYRVRSARSRSAWLSTSRIWSSNCSRLSSALPLSENTQTSGFRPSAPSSSSCSQAMCAVSIGGEDRPSCSPGTSKPTGAPECAPLRTGPQSSTHQGGHRREPCSPVSFRDMPAPFPQRPSARPGLFGISRRIPSGGMFRTGCGGSLMLPAVAGPPDRPCSCTHESHSLPAACPTAGRSVRLQVPIPVR